MPLTDKLTAIADGFRESRETTQKYTLDEMAILAAEKITQPSGTLEIKENGTHDVKNYAFVNVNVAGGGSDGSPFCEVTISTPSGVEYYYNHELLPEIPPDIAEDYPYITVIHSLVSTRIFACVSKPYYDTENYANARIVFPGNYVRYLYNSSANAWVLDGIGASTYCPTPGVANWSIRWSNNDVPNGSPDSTVIYFPTSEPQTEQPAAATHFYYNGLSLPVIPADVLAQYPYAWIRKHTANDQYQLIFAAYPWYYNGENAVCCSGGDSVTEPWYNVTISTADAATVWTFNKDATGSFGVDSARTVLWSNHDIPNGSATATDIYFCGSVAIPNPL